MRLTERNFSRNPHQKTVILIAHIPQRKKTKVWSKRKNEESNPRSFQNLCHTKTKQGWRRADTQVPDCSQGETDRLEPKERKSQRRIELSDVHSSGFWGCEIWARSPPRTAPPPPTPTTGPSQDNPTKACHTCWNWPRFWAAACQSPHKWLRLGAEKFFCFFFGLIFLDLQFATRTN